jgi:hypothetical protein
VRLSPSRLAPPALVALSLLLAPSAGAQAVDSLHWSIFAGRSLSPAAGADRTVGPFAENFGLGASVDFRSSLLPIPLRATVAYDKFRGGPGTTYKVTALRLEGIFRPVPAVLGIRPYLLGGFGIATQSPTGMHVIDDGIPTFVPIARHGALQLHAGAGLEFRAFFVEYRRSPFTAAGTLPAQSSQINLGVRF